MPMVADVAARTRVRASIMHEHVAMQLGHQRRLEWSVWRGAERGQVGGGRQHPRSRGSRVGAGGMTSIQSICILETVACNLRTGAGTAAVIGALG